MKVRKIKLFGAIYFAGLGIANLIGVHEIQWIDLILFAISILPLLINKKLFLISYGFFAGLISLYIGYACTVFTFNQKVGTTATDLLMGYALFFFSLMASCALWYAGLQSSTNKREFSLI
ncbi:hypothetical protein [Flavobacterium sp. 3HN19-14]|uniref:hypothetical protein n=1 Tax=Flavobacterium sp. 3HN19-14 TaxID=3448133 RepID=UPI003EE3B4F5